MTIELTDDGTMDTVLRCSECGEEFRFNYDPDTDDNDPDGRDVPASQYDAYVAECIAEIESEHECKPDDDEPSEPDDDDLTTSDHRTFYQSGKLAFTLIGTGEFHDAPYRIDLPAASRVKLAPARYSDVKSAVRAYMDAAQYWPNCWFLSDHGNAHLMRLG